MSDKNEYKARHPRLLPLLLLLLVVIAYLNSFSGVFLFDDQSTILTNRSITHLWPPWAAVRLANRWLVDISFAVNYAISEFAATGFHIGNLIFHALAGLLLFGVVRRILSGTRFSGRYGPASEWIAFVCAALWLVHPLQTESVTYMCQRYESMMGMCYLLTMYCFIRATQSERGRWWYAATVASFIIGMGTKEVMVTVLVMMVVYDWIVSPGSVRDMLRARWKFYLVLAVTLAIPAVIWIKLLNRFAGWDVPTAPGATPYTYLLTQAEVITHYLRLSFAPHPQCFDYRWPIVGGIGDVILPLLLVSGLFLLSAWAVITRKGLGLAGAWFFVILAPTSSIMPIADPAAEHRMYLPVAAVIVAVVIGLYELFRSDDARPGPFRTVPLLYAIITLAAITGLTTLTLCRNEDYSSANRMWGRVVALRPDNWRAHLQLAAAYYIRGEYADAAEASEHLLERLPDFSGVQVDELLAKEGEPGAEALFIKADAYARAHNTLGSVAFVEKHIEEAHAYFLEGVRLAPGNPAHRVNLGLALYALGNRDEAVDQWKEALKMRGHDISPYYHLATVYEAEGDYEGALANYQRVLNLNEGNSVVQFRMAWILATSPDDSIRDGQRAVELASRASEMMEHQNFEILDTLAAALAECGNFEEAVGAESQAIQMIIDYGKMVKEERFLKRAEEYVERLKLYEAHKPYRQSPKTPAGEDAGIRE